MTIGLKRDEKSDRKVPVYSIGMLAAVLGWLGGHFLGERNTAMLAGLVFVGFFVWLFSDIVRGVKRRRALSPYQGALLASLICFAVGIQVARLL